MTVRNNLLALGICFLLSGAVHASHDGVNTDFGPGNSGAGRNDALVDPTQPSCVGDFLSAWASTSNGIDVPAYMEFEGGGPGTITQGISDLMGLGGVIGLDNSEWDYATCEDQFFAQE